MMLGQFPSVIGKKKKNMFFKALLAAGLYVIESYFTFGTYGKLITFVNQNRNFTTKAARIKQESTLNGV